MDDIKAAIKLSPNDKNFRAQFEKVKKQKQEEAKATAGQMQALFSQGLYNEKEAPKPDDEKNVSDCCASKSC